MNTDLLNGGTLAFIGDAVMTLQIREYLISIGYTRSKQLQEITSAYVSATNQAKFVHRIMNQLTEEETEVYKRGRNFKSHSSAKNANILDYRAATGLEALWGYWYLNKNYDRLQEMFIQLTEEKKEEQ